MFRTIITWLCIVHPPADPIRYRLNKILAAVIIFWLFSALLFLGILILIGAAPLAVMGMGGASLGLILAWWWNRKGSVLGAVALAAVGIIMTPSIVLPREYPIAAPTLIVPTHLLFFIPILQTALFISPRASMLAGGATLLMIGVHLWLQATPIVVIAAFLGSTLVNLLIGGVPLLLISLAWRDMIQQQAHYAQQLEALIKERRVEIEQIIHDLDNPLQRIVLTLEEMPQEHGQGTAAYAAIARDIQRLCGLVTDLRTTVLLQSGKLQPRPQPVDLGKLLAELVEQFGTDPRFRSCQLRLVCAADTPPAYCDLRQMERVFVNIIKNALAYTKALRGDGSGRVDIHLVSPTSAKLAVTITDNGIGLTEAELSRLGQRFARFHQGEVPQGMGLGLNVCASLVQRNGGTLTISSAGKHQGTIVTIMLPASTQGVPNDTPTHERR